MIEFIGVKPFWYIFLLIRQQFTIGIDVAGIPLSDLSWLRLDLSSIYQWAIKFKYLLLHLRSAMSRFPCNVFTAPVGNKKSLALILIVILVGTIGNSGCLFSSQASASDSSKKKKVSKKKKSKSQKKNAPEEKIEDGETVGIGIPNDKNVKEIIELQPFIVNLADQDESRYLRLSVSLGIGESKEEKPSQFLFLAFSYT
jgi:flagellar basal body-associated protein FliL